jgi:uncharacterized protein with FMN-binding domain
VVPDKKRGSNQRVASHLVALSSAAVLSVYAVGYLRTRPAVERYADALPARRAESPAIPPPVTAVAPPAPRDAAPVRAPAPTNAAPSRPTPALGKQTSDPADVADVAVIPPDTPVVVETSEPAPVPIDLPPEPSPVPTAAAPNLYKDGTYLGWGSCRHGDIQASVVIENGRIASAAIAQCRTRYSCNWIETLPREVVGRQSANVDYVSGATESTDAFADAVADALAQAK